MQHLPINARYESPLSTRYASPEMSYLFSDSFRIITFRRLWIALAIAQKKLGLPITSQQIEQMQQKIDTIDPEAIQQYEKQFRHDIMAHIHAFAELCPDAKPIIHLGATSTYVTDNADLIQIKEAMHLLHAKLISLLKKLSQLAHEYANAPTLGFTHYQPAQPTTIGKRFCLWLQDFYHDALDWERLSASLPFLGTKGATGTQASFLSLFEGNDNLVKELEKLISDTFGFSSVLPIASQTYSRKIDLSFLNALASFAASAHKMATDLRLLAHEQECKESFGESQIGSSAMPYKQNPIYAERICGLSRFVLSLAQNPAYTTATQWLERSLDDSSNRRISIPEAFLATDAILNLLIHLLNHVEVNTELAYEHLLEKVPFLAMENLLMAIVKKGGDRQSAHETLRLLAFQLLKEEDPHAFFLQELTSQFNLSKKEIAPYLDVQQMIGRAPKQVIEFLHSYIKPYLLKHEGKEAVFPEIEV